MEIESEFNSVISILLQMHLFSTIFTFTLLMLGTLAQPNKKCPTIVTQKDFVINQYMGIWYELYRNDIFFELGMKCVNATYTLNPDGTVGVWNQATNWVGQHSDITGTARVKNPAEPASLVVTFNNNPLQKGDYNILSTNYNEYALVYACRDVPLIGKWEFMWILSRAKTLPISVVQDLKKTLSDMGANADSLKPTDQSC